MAKVLIVDDEPFTVEMLETFLRMSGYETVGALSGEDGIVLSQIESPDLLILDLMLPDLEGYEVCRRLRTLAPTAALPVLILSARVAQVDRDKARDAGANGYLTKPVQFPALLSELSRLLQPSSGPDATAASNGSSTPGSEPRAETP